MSGYVRTITFAATSKGVTPTGPQEAGVQGDHNATVVVWQLDETLINAAYRYRCEYVDGSGGWDTTPYLALESGNTISVPLPRAWTAAGGCAVIRLCVSEFTEGREERSIYTLTGRLQYAGRESGGAMAEEYEDKLPALIMAVTESMNEAEAAAAGAEAAAAGANEAASGASGAAAAAEEAAMTANAAAASANRLSETMNNELHGEAIHLEYEIGGFDVSQGGEVVAAIRARPVDKAIFVRKGMRVTGGGVYQVYVVAVDSTGAALEVLCSYANEYVAQADGYIRYTVKSIANPDTELTEADLPLIAEKVVIRKDDNVNKRIGTLAETMNNELYGEALHLEYEVGGFDASLGQVNTKVRARPVDKAIFVRKGMRITGGGTYQVDVTAVDSAGAVVKHLCSYADEYVMQADGYIRYTVKSIENPTVELTEADLPAIAEKVVILNDNSMDKRLEALEKSDRFWATSGTWDIRQGFSGSDYTQNANGNVDVPADTVLYRDAVTDLLFQKLTWTFKVNTVGAFAFGTRDGSGAANGYYVLVNPADKTLKIYNSDWKGTLSIKRNLTIDFDILAGETYYAEIIKTGTLSTEFTLKCISAPGKTFSYTHNQLNNKLRGWGGVAFGSAGGVFELVNMTQKARSEAECEVLLIGDSFLENASSELESEYAYAYKLREKLGEKLIASGRGGATTAALKNKYTTDFLAAKAKYTVLQIGSNDSLSLTVATFKMNLLELIGRVEENGSIPVLVTIPRRYDTDNTAFITEVNAWIKSLGYWYIDEYALLPADRLLNDTIHPNAEGHDLILSNLLALIPV